jgi:hypothetical protein
MQILGKRNNLAKENRDSANVNHYLAALTSYLTYAVEQ